MIFGNIQNSMLETELALLPKPLRDAICFLRDHDMAAPIRKIVIKVPLESCLDEGGFSVALSQEKPL